MRLTRVIAQPDLPMLDPFLLLDEFGSDKPGDYIAGFPDHPHRGFETVTYLLAGRMRHRDNQGNEGLLTPGSVQWMTAGRGIVHSEMPEQENGLLRGFQLWVNLPAGDKMTAPRYQDIAPERIPDVASAGANVRVVAGSYGGVTGPVSGIATEPLYLDVELDAGARFDAAVAPSHNAFVYVYDGAVRIGDAALGRGDLAVLTAGDAIAVEATDPAAFLVVAGKPLGEPVARYGPIVMNTRAELERAFEDLREGRF